MLQENLSRFTEKVSTLIDNYANLSATLAINTEKVTYMQKNLKRIYGSKIFSSILNKSIQIFQYIIFQYLFYYINIFHSSNLK